jgi:peptidoglycan/xylan/chitin deacetylase (PgdA/CDA1 family)
MKKFGRILILCSFVLGVVIFLYAILTIFFDEAILVRQDTFYKAKVNEKVVALTFDDGPSPVWTPKILAELKKSGIKATFFMLGKHVLRYPDIARSVVNEGNEIGIHSYEHKNYIFYTKFEVKKDIENTQKIIKDVIGKETFLFRPPKAWLSKREKKKIKGLGFEVVLWTLNSKDWVTFDDKYMIWYIIKNIRPGDIILFHDSGGVFSTEGGNRDETVKAIPRLVEKLKQKGYRFLTVSKLLDLERAHEN